jgi:hypothetical protein
MDTLKPTISGERIIATMIELARSSSLHRIIVAGSKGPRQLFELYRRGYSRVATTANCGLPRGQYDVALVEWQLHSLKALETTLDWLVHFLAPSSVLVIWIDASESTNQRKLGSILEKLGFRLEAGTRCEGGLAIAARRLDANQQAIAA